MDERNNLYEDVETSLLHGEETISRGARWFYQDFTDFLGRDNVLEVALGLIIGASFSGLVQSLTQDILLPPLSLLSPKSGNLASLFWVLRRGDTPDAVYNTREQAAADGISHTPIFLLILGATYLSYGVFIQKCIDFIILGLSLYFLVQSSIGFQAYTDGIVLAMAGQEGIIKRTKKCKECRKQISEKSMRCAFCTSWQPGSNRENH